MKPKPKYCWEYCRYAKTSKDKKGWRVYGGSGFCPPDSATKAITAKVAIVLEAPGKWEALRNLPVIGPTGDELFNEFIHPRGYKRSDIFIDNTIRCHPPQNKYPTGELRKDAEATCRHWDVWLDKFNPNVIGVTFHPASLFRQRQRTRLIEAAVSKLFGYYEQGYRPLLLMGAKAMNVFLPDLPGNSVKNWQGSFWPIKWKPAGDKRASAQLKKFIRKRGL